MNKTYTYKEVYETSLAYFKQDELAATTWMNKYAMKDAEGQFLERSPEDMHRRMATEFTRIEKKYADSATPTNQEALSDYGRMREELGFERIFNLFDRFEKVIPQGSVMAALGNPYMLASLSNCVVMPELHDSYGGIFRTDQQLAQLFKRRCGVGIDISALRPAHTRVANAAGTTSGAASFMERFSNTTREVAQHGRRGALMITMDVRHPDIEQFVTMKQDLSKVTGANVSVRLSDEFMLAVENDSEFTLRWPIESENPKITHKIKARELWQTIISCAHATAEPGLIFWDRQHLYSTSSIYPDFKNVSTNPCSEIAMQGGDSCRLIALNLYSFVQDPFTKNAVFDIDAFYKVTYESQRLMDDLVDLELEAIDRILAKIESDPEPLDLKQEELNTWKLLRETGKKGRRTGLGFTGLADAISALGFHLESDEALAQIDAIIQSKLRAEFDSSVDLAVERGRFSLFDPEVEIRSEFIQMLQKEFPDVYDRMMKYGRRNISISTVAPTGSLSLLAQTSSGIEPVFMLSYKRRRKITKSDEKVDFEDAMGDKWQEFMVFHPKLKTWMEVSGETDLEKSPYFHSTAPEIDWKKRVEIQALVQKYVTHSISSTINLPSDVSVERVGEIYLESWRKGLKGITVYREGSRSGVLVRTKDKVNIPSEIIETKPPKRPEILEADILRFNNNDEKWIAVVGLLNGRPYEIFTGRAVDSFFLPDYVNKGFVLKVRLKDGMSRYDFQYFDKDSYKVTIEGLSRSFDKETWNYAKLISGVIRHGMPLPFVVDLVTELDLSHDTINTWKNGVARALKKYIENGTKAGDKLCPVCHDPEGLIYEEGCLKCKNCGHTVCG